MTNYCLLLFVIIVYCSRRTYGNTELWKCGRSFLDLPTIYIKGQIFEDFCIPLAQDFQEQSSSVSCGMDAEHACLAVRYLKNYNVPLYVAIHFENTPSVVVGLSRPNNYPNGRPIGTHIPLDDGIVQENLIGGPLMTGRIKTPVQAWTEIAWGRGSCDGATLFHTLCTEEMLPKKSECNTRTCCWDDNVKQCFKKTLPSDQHPQCSAILKSYRQICSARGTSKDECEAIGCCYDDEICFNPIPRCEVSFFERKKCGEGEMDETSCLSSGCCWSKQSTCYYPLGSYEATKLSDINIRLQTGTENYDPTRHVKGNFVYSSLVKRIRASLAPRTSNLFNTFVQYAGANLANIPRETQIENIMFNCLNTKGIKQKYLKNDFYFISGTKPIDPASKDAEDFNGENVPQLHWTAMCCVMQFKDLASSEERMYGRTFAFSRGYISSNERPVNAKPKGETSSFHIFPKDGDPALLDLEEMKEVLVNYSEEKTDNPIDMTIDSFFGPGSVCDVKTKKTPEQEQHEAAYFDQFKRLLVQQPDEDTLEPAEALKRLQQFFRPAK